MLIESFRAKDAALQAASYALKDSDVFDAEAKDLISKTIAAAIEAAFDALEDMQEDENRRRF